MMIERYIYAVTKELPRDIRKETSDELRRVISKRVRSLNAPLSEEEKIRQVLTELGNPKIVAKQYMKKERYLICPKYFDKYLLVLKVVFVSILIGLSVVYAFSVIFSVNSLLEVIGGYISSLVSAFLQGAAWVTGVFALLEYNEVSLDNEREKEPWTPSKLAPIPAEKARISRGESIFSIIFITFFITIFFFAPDVIGIFYFIGDEIEFIPLFHLPALATYRLFIFIIFTIDIFSELIKMIQGRWTRGLAFIVVALNILSTVLLIYVLSRPSIWNEAMQARIERFLSLPFERLLMAVMVGILFFSLVDSLSVLYKGTKYSERGEN